LDTNSKYITKFVLCPVVDNVPLLSTVLYNGHTYIPSVGATLFYTGTNNIIGTLENNSLGLG